MAVRKENNNRHPELNNDTYKDNLLKEHLYLIGKERKCLIVKNKKIYKKVVGVKMRKDKRKTQ